MAHVCAFGQSARPCGRSSCLGSGECRHDYVRARHVHLMQPAHAARARTPQVHLLLRRLPSLSNRSRRSHLGLAASKTSSLKFGSRPHGAPAPGIYTSSGCSAGICVHKLSPVAPASVFGSIACGRRAGRRRRRGPRRTGLLLLLLGTGTGTAQQNRVHHAPRRRWESTVGVEGVVGARQAVHFWVSSS